MGFRESPEGEAVWGAWVRVVLASSLGAPFDAAAYEGDSSIRSGPVDSTSNAPDRNFIKQWEANPPKGFPTLSPANVEATKAAIRRYQDIVAKGGWDRCPRGSCKRARPDRPWRSCASGSRLGRPARGQRLRVVGKLRLLPREGGQALPGLQRPDADGDRRQAHHRRAQRVGRVAPAPGSRRTSAHHRARPLGRQEVPDGQHPRRADRGGGGRPRRLAPPGVVGKPDRPTPLLRTAIHEINFNPVWRLPPTVIQKDLIPKGREMQKAGKNVLVKFGIDAYDGNGRKLEPEKINWSSALPMALSYSQQPGKDNPLGFLKINFHNDHSVYMHDTPSETLFGRNFRAASSGCVRVQHRAGGAGCSPTRAAGPRSASRECARPASAPTSS